MGHYGTYTFFLACSATECEWLSIIQVIKCSYGKELPHEQIYAVDWDTECSYLNRNRVTSAHQIDCFFLI